VAYICPLHQELLDTIDEAGASERYDQRLEEFYALASRYGLSVWDFSHQNSFARSSLQAGSNEYYSDVSHFSPLLGRLVLKRPGFETTSSTDQSWVSFGVPLAPRPEK